MPATHPSTRNSLPPPHIDQVVLGSTVTIYDVRSGERDIYTLVPPAQADIRQNRLSSLTPIGLAIFGRREGDVVEFDAPAGKIKVRIEAITMAPDATTPPLP